MTEHGSSMTELDPPISTRNGEASQVIDIELLISEVKKRPLLYSREQAEYFEKLARRKKWTEVCQALFQQWNNFSPRKKVEKVREVQNKWQKLKQLFLKSFGGTRKLSPLAKTKRRQQLQSMLFLVQTTVGHDDNEDAPVMGSLSNEQEDLNVIPMPSTSGQDVTNAKTNEIKKEPFVIPKLENLGTGIEPKYDPIDENMHFALMLVPLLRKLNSEQRFYAWPNIIEVLKNAAEMGPKKICVLQNELKYPEPEGTSNLLQQNIINYAEPEQDVALEEDPAFPPSHGRPTNSQGEIMYPETDMEDLYEE